MMKASSSYSQYYKTKLEGALLYQDFIVDLSLNALGLAIVQYASKAYQQAIGESRTGFEIKFDEMFSKTGNLWIEISEKAKPREGAYYPSGIYRNDNSWFYVIGDYDTVFYFPKKFLVSLHKSGRYRVLENNTKTSEGFLLSEFDANKYAAIILKPKAKDKISKLTVDLSSAGRELHQIVKGDPSQASLFDDLADGCL